MADPVSHDFSALYKWTTTTPKLRNSDYNIPQYCSTFSDGTWSRLLAVVTLMVISTIWKFLQVAGPSSCRIKDLSRTCIGYVISTRYEDS